MTADRRGGEPSQCLLGRLARFVAADWRGGGPRCQSPRRPAPLCGPVLPPVVQMSHAAPRLAQRECHCSRGARCTSEPPSYTWHLPHSPCPSSSQPPAPNPAVMKTQAGTQSIWARPAGRMHATCTVDVHVISSLSCVNSHALNSQKVHVYSMIADTIGARASDGAVTVGSPRRRRRRGDADHALPPRVGGLRI